MKVKSVLRRREGMYIGRCIEVNSGQELGPTPPFPQNPWRMDLRHATCFLPWPQSSNRHCGLVFTFGTFVDKGCESL